MNSATGITDVANMDECFEVDDISAFDPVENTAVAPAAKPSRSAAKAAAKAAKSAAAKSLPMSPPQQSVVAPAPIDDAEMELELSADDMDALLEDDVISVEIS